MKVSKDSLLNWYPEIKDLNIPQAKTGCVVLSQSEYETTFEAMPKEVTKRVQRLVNKHFKLSVFIRTDLSSAKFDWDKSCFYDGVNPLWKHLLRLAEFNHVADIMGLPFRAFVVREFIPMDWHFLAFYGNMPVSPERRYYIENGNVLCHHPYWIEDAIKKSPALPDNWQELSKEINTETLEEVVLLTGYASEVAQVLKGFWSVDFCRAKDGRWILIDMATGERSWHPDSCPNNRTIKHDYIMNGPRVLDEFIEVDEGLIKVEYNE